MVNIISNITRASEVIAQLEEAERIKELKFKEQIEEAVFICNHHMKYAIQTALPQYDFCIVGNDACEDDKLYMITDKTLADNIRQNLNFIKGKNEEVSNG